MLIFCFLFGFSSVVSASLRWRQTFIFLTVIHLNILSSFWGVLYKVEEGGTLRDLIEWGPPNIGGLGAGAGKRMRVALLRFEHLAHFTAPRHATPSQRYRAWLTARYVNSSLKRFLFLRSPPGAQRESAPASRPLRAAPLALQGRHAGAV
ncbi:MAG: hypothetical protein ACE5PV_03005 [Candidatus Poribacteria bacterium]